MKGVWHRILRVDLSKRTAAAETVPDKIYDMFIGGAGLGAWILYKEVPGHVKAFDPDNRIIFATGPFQGVAQTGAAKWTVVAKSPAIEMNATSCITAAWGCELKAAGFDAVVVQGKADKPVYVYVDDDKAEIRDASHLWGKDATETDINLKGELGDKFEIATIGPAGERLSRMACIMTAQKSAAGRGGLGAVMGSKKLKAIAVHGTKKCEVADAKGLQNINIEINRRVAETDAAKNENFNIRRHGTSIATGLFAGVGNMPIKNWQLGEFQSGVERLGAPHYGKELNTTPWPCRYCVLQCHNKVNLKEGKYAFVGQGPEYESFAMMGLNLLIDDIRAVAYANDLCNRYGLDTISVGATLAWAYECYEKGVLTKSDTYGFELTWGNADSLVEMVRKIGERTEGLGWLMGEGVKIAAEKVGKGSEAWAVQMKGLEIPAHDPRAAYVAGLNYCTAASCGPNHEKGNPQHIFVAHIRLPELGIGDDIDHHEAHSWEKASFYTATFQNYANIVDSMVHCKFMVFSGYKLSDLLDTFNAITGMGWDYETLNRTGERIFQVQRLLNMRYGNTKAADLAFPARLMQPKPDGPVAGVIPAGIEQAVEAYYRFRNWDESGMPTRAKIREMGLEELPV